MMKTKLSNQIKLLLILFFINGNNFFAQTSITSTATITQSLTGFVGTSSTIPANWKLEGSGTNGNNYAGSSQTTNSAGGWYGNDNISYLGSGSANNGNATWKLQNNSGSIITDFNLSFDARMWKSGSASPKVTISYSISSSATYPVAGNLNSISSLTFSDSTANILTGTNLSALVSGLTINNGDYLYIRFIHAGGSNSDNLGWDEVKFTPTFAAPCTAPPTPNGNLTKTANCGSTDLKYTYGTGEPATNVTYYWQTSTTGTSTANQVVSGSNYNVSNATPTTYYVRAKDGNCWSTASTGIAVTNVFAPTVTNPANQSVNSSQTATFSVTATNQISYQWQYSANGTTWNNIDTVAEPSAATAIYNTPATTLSMNGYLYRCIAVANSPCSNVISNSATLTVLQGPCIQEGFNNGITAPAGWTFTGITATYTTAGNYGQGSPSLKFDDSGDQIVTSTVSNASELSFWIKGQSISATQPSSLLVEGFNGTSWVTVDNITALPTVGTTKIYNSSSTPALPANLQRFRFTYSKNVGNVSFDDVKVLCVVNTATPSIILSNNGSQISAGNVPQGSINNILSTFKIDVSANTTNLLAADIYFDGTYTNTDISTNGLKLWSNTTNDFTTAINLGAASSTAATSGAGDAIVFNFNSAPKYINTGTTYFWVTADISSTATIGRTVQALSIANSDLHFYVGTKSGTASMGGLKTISLAPPQKPQTFTKNCTSNNSQELSWTPPASGSFDGYLLVARQGGLPQAVTNIVASSTSGNLDFSVAPLYGTVPQNSKILYVGSGTNVTVTGLTADLNYTFALYTYKNNGATTVYSEVTTRSQTITLNNVSAPNAVGGNTTAEVSWLNPASTCFDDIMVVVTPTSGLTFNPSGNTYTANSNYLGSGSQVVYKNNGNSVVITSLTNGTTYYIEIYVRKGSQWSKGIEIPVTPNANTVFKAGDLFFVGYNANYSGSSDEYLIATMVDIQPGTQFSIVNSRYEAGAAAGVRTRKWGGSSINASEFPGVIQVEYNGATIAKGSVLVVRTSNLPETPISYFGIINPSNNLSDHTTEISASVVFPFSPPRVPNISISSPDQMFLVQGVFSFDGTNDIGEANYILNGTLLHGFTNRTSWVPLSQANSGGSNDADRRSRKPSELECFNFESPADDIAYYKNDQLHSGSFREILQHISNSANWGGTYTLTPNNFGAAYAGRSFVINSGNPPGSWVSTSDTNWFYCANWENLRVPDEKTDVFISGATANADIKSNAAYAELYNKIAKARNVFVSDNILKVNGSVLNTLEVHGDININTGGLIDMQSGGSQDGKIYLYGNWNNNDIINGFNEGNGTVYLSGTQLQIINSNDHNSPEIFNNLEINNNFNTAVSNNLITNGYLKIGSGKSVTIAPNDYFRIGGEITSDGNLTVESDGNLLQVNNVSNTGAITVKRDAHRMKYLEYTYWASPVSGQTFKSFSPTTPDARFYQYNESNDLFESIQNPSTNVFGNNKSGTFESAAKGYAIRYYGTSNLFTGIFKGVPNNGDITFPLKFKSGATGQGYGYNMVGNPYPSNIDFYKLHAANSTLIYNTAYFWTNVNPNGAMQGSNYPNGALINNYAVLNGTGGVGATSSSAVNGSQTPNQFIKVGQGFIVKAKASGNLQFTNGDGTTGIRTANNTGYFFNNRGTTVDRFWLELKTPLDVVTTQLIGYLPAATYGFERDYDSPLLTLGADAFYSSLETYKLAIQGRGIFTATDIVPLGTSHYAAGNYTIILKEREGIFAGGQNIYLKDKQTGTVTNLTEGSYTFAANKGENTGRFEIIYEPQVVLATDSAQKDDLVVYKNMGDFVVRSQKRDIDQLEVYDAGGRLIYAAKPNKRETVINAEYLVEGVYVLKITRNGEVSVKKMLKN